MSDPAVPPTPPVPLAALLAREDLALRQIAGPSDPDIVIHWAHTSEMADPYPYLLGGELLLTAGVHIPEAAGSGTYFDDYVARIVAAGGAALGFGVAPVHDTVPRALVAACEAYELPLVEVPPQTTFSGVARAVWQLMAQARLAELRRVTEAQQSLAAGPPAPTRSPPSCTGSPSAWAAGRCCTGRREPRSRRRDGRSRGAGCRRPWPDWRRSCGRAPRPSGPAGRRRRQAGCGKPPPGWRRRCGPVLPPGGPAGRRHHRQAGGGKPRPGQPRPCDPVPPPGGPAGPHRRQAGGEKPRPGRRRPCDPVPPPSGPAGHRHQQARCEKPRPGRRRPCDPVPPPSGPVGRRRGRASRSPRTARPRPPAARRALMPPAARRSLMPPAEPRVRVPPTAPPARCHPQLRPPRATHSSACLVPPTARRPRCHPQLRRPRCHPRHRGPRCHRRPHHSGRRRLVGLWCQRRPSRDQPPRRRPAPTSATDTIAGTHLAAYALGAGQGFVLGVTAPRRQPGDHAIASVAAVLLALLTGEHQSGTGAARSSALVRVLLGAAPEAVAPLLGGERWVVVHARPDGHAPDAVASSALGRVARLAAGRPGAGRRTGARAGRAGTGAAARLDAGRQRRRRSGRVGLRRRPGGPCPGPGPGHPHAAGPARQPARPWPTWSLRRRPRRTPGRCSRPSPPVLAETLRTWLSLHGSWDRTAVALGVHRNTVRQRIARCAALLAADLDEPDVRMELWFALRRL